MPARALRRRDESLEEFPGKLTAGMGRSERRRWAGVYVRGLLLDGTRENVEPMTSRRGESDQDLHHFVSPSPWSADVLLEGLAKTTATAAPSCWVIGETSFPEAGQHSAGVHPVRQLCRVFGVARSAYYAAQRKAERPRARDNVRLSPRARELFEASGRTYGSPRLAVALRRAGERCGRRRVAALMRRAGLHARQTRRFRPRTTDSRHRCAVAPNHLAERARNHLPGPARCGRPTSPVLPPGWVGSTSLACSTPAHAGSWAGRRTTPCPPVW